MARELLLEAIGLVLGTAAGIAATPYWPALVALVERLTTRKRP